MEPFQSSYTTSTIASDPPSTESGIVRIKRPISEIQNDIKKLSLTPDVPIGGLTHESDIYKVYVSTYSDIRLLYSKLDPCDYTNDIINFIATLPRPDIIVPGTLGAFVFGCLYNINPKENAFCSPACAGSIPPSPEFIKHTPCESQVWTYHSGKLMYESGSGNEAKVFSRDTPLMWADVVTLSKNGAKKITVYSKKGVVVEEREINDEIGPNVTQNINTLYGNATQQPNQLVEQITQPTHGNAVQQVHQVPLQGVQTSQQVQQPSSLPRPNATNVVLGGENESTTKPTFFFSNWLIWVVVIIVILVVIALIYYYFFKTPKAIKTTEVVKTQ